VSYFGGDHVAGAKIVNHFHGTAAGGVQSADFQYLTQYTEEHLRPFRTFVAPPDYQKVRAALERTAVAALRGPAGSGRVATALAVLADVGARRRYHANLRALAGAPLERGGGFILDARGGSATAIDKLGDFEVRSLLARIADHEGWLVILRDAAVGHDAAALEDLTVELSGRMPVRRIADAHLRDGLGPFDAARADHPAIAAAISAVPAWLACSDAAAIGRRTAALADRPEQAAADADRTIRTCARRRVDEWGSASPGALAGLVGHQDPDIRHCAALAAADLGLPAGWAADAAAGLRVAAARASGWSLGSVGVLDVLSADGDPAVTAAVGSAVADLAGTSATAAETALALAEGWLRDRDREKRRTARLVGLAIATSPVTTAPWTAAELTVPGGGTPVPLVWRLAEEAGGGGDRAVRIWAAALLSREFGQPAAMVLDTWAVRAEADSAVRDALAGFLTRAAAAGADVRTALTRRARRWTGAAGAGGPTAPHTGEHVTALLSGHVTAQVTDLPGREK
jgi:hypothetical protein